MTPWHPVSHPEEIEFKIGQLVQRKRTDDRTIDLHFSYAPCLIIEAKLMATIFGEYWQYDAINTQTQQVERFVWSEIEHL